MDVYKLSGPFTLLGRIYFEAKFLGMVFWRMIFSFRQPIISPINLEDVEETRKELEISGLCHIFLHLFLSLATFLHDEPFYGGREPEQWVLNAVKFRPASKFPHSRVVRELALPPPLFNTKHAAPTHSNIPLSHL